MKGKGELFQCEETVAVSKGFSRGFGCTEGCEEIEWEQGKDSSALGFLICSMFLSLLLIILHCN